MHAWPAAKTKLCPPPWTRSSATPTGCRQRVEVSEDRPVLGVHPSGPRVVPVRAVEPHRRDVTVDLDAQVVHLPGDEDLPFDVDPFARMMLLAGTDELGYLLGKTADIAAWEATHPGRVDTLAPTA